LGNQSLFFFSEFDQNSIAAASIAQVHHAVRKDGTEVAVKIQYPFIKENFRGDMWSSDFALWLVATAFKEYNLRFISEEIRTNLIKELDFEN